MSLRIESCRSCTAPIIWAVTKAAHRFMPVDAEPSDNGNVELVDGPGGAAPTAIVHAQPPLDLVGALRLPHHASCPHGKQWRRTA